MDLKTTWKCRNGITQYLEANPNSPQIEVLIKTLAHLIKELRDNNQNIGNLEKNTLELQKDAANADDDEKKIDSINFHFDCLIFPIKHVYPAVSTMDFTNKAIKVYELLSNPILRANALSVKTIEVFCSQGKDTDSASITEAEREAVITVYGEGAKVVSFDEFLDYIISQEADYCLSQNQE